MSALINGTKEGRPIGLYNIDLACEKGLYLPHWLVFTDWLYANERLRVFHVIQFHYNSDGPSDCMGRRTILPWTNNMGRWSVVRLDGPSLF